LSGIDGEVEMRRMRVGMLATVAATVIAMAFGAGSASALTTKLCEVGTSPCPAANTYGRFSRFSVFGEFGIDPITGCYFEYEFETLAIAAWPLPGRLDSFETTSCGSGYAVTPVGLDWTYPIAGSGALLSASVKVKGEKLEPGFEVNGNGEFGCQYTVPVFLQFIGGGMIVGGPTALPNTAGFGCEPSVTVSMGGFPTPEFFVTE
jgi:hypothetical protein